jgi:E3 ubiquitin-protein ligase synoviolin
MFVSLFVGKLWGWLAEGRIETLEQQPPANPRLFHTRLISSLTLYVLFAMEMFRYCLDTVFYEARPGVMVMFVFEFAIISISAVSTVLRYTMWAWEHRIIKKQTKERKEALKKAIREARETHDQAQTQNSGYKDESSGTPVVSLQTEEEVDEEEIEVPGWEAKGSWLFALDIGTDFLKLVAYMAFFTILTVFYGIPIYIIRDMYLTLRSFTKRVSDYIRYQQATRDMHARYPDATAQELEPDNTCIVCREEMRPWHAMETQGRGAVDPLAHSVNERHRPKKLPCGHILHFGCLRSWLERQQACPICRRSVLASVERPAANMEAGDQPPNNAQANAQPQRAGGRVFQFGPLRLGIAFQQFDRLGQERVNANGQAQVPAQQPVTTAATQAVDTPQNLTPQQQQAQNILRSAVTNWQLNRIEHQLQQEIQSLNLSRQRLQVVRALLLELERLRAQPIQQAAQPGYPLFALPHPFTTHTNSLLPFAGIPHLSTNFTPGTIAINNVPLVMTPNGAQSLQGTAPTEQDQLPPGLVLPPGWRPVTLRPMSGSTDSEIQSYTSVNAQPSQSNENIAQTVPPPTTSQTPSWRRSRESSDDNLFTPLPSGTAEPAHMSSESRTTLPDNHEVDSHTEPLSPRPVKPATASTNLDHTYEHDGTAPGIQLGSSSNSTSTNLLGADSSWSFPAPNGSADNSNLNTSASAGVKSSYQPTVEDGDAE